MYKYALLVYVYKEGVQGSGGWMPPPPGMEGAQIDPAGGSQDPPKVKCFLPGLSAENFFAFLTNF